jgi:hypothetical protein
MERREGRGERGRGRRRGSREGGEMERREGRGEGESRKGEKENRDREMKRVRERGERGGELTERVERWRERDWESSPLSVCCVCVRGTRPQNGAVMKVPSLVLSLSSVIKTGRTKDC